MDLEWLFRFHGYNGPERTYKYYQLFSVKEMEEEDTTDVCKERFRKTEEEYV